jgi:Ca2+-transporting ATPase
MRQAHADRRLEREYPLTAERLAGDERLATLADGRRLAATKGAPETVARLCALDPSARAALLGRVDAMARAGLRVLAVAVAGIPAGRIRAGAPGGLPFRLLGLVGLADPIRATVPAAVAHLPRRRRARHDDHRRLPRDRERRGAPAWGSPVRTPSLRRGARVGWTTDALARRIEDADVFARILPEQKLRICARVPGARRGSWR